MYAGLYKIRNRCGYCMNIREVILLWNLLITIYVRIYDFCENSYLLFLRKLINFCHCLKFDFSIVSSLSISTIFNVKYHFAYLLLLLNTKSTVAIDKASKNIKKIRKWKSFNWIFVSFSIGCRDLNYS